MQHSRNVGIKMTIAAPLGSELVEEINRIQEVCIECPKCANHCAFLKKFGNPRQIAMACGPDDISTLNLSFMCNLCDLCAAVCPMGLAPGQLFLEMRREAVRRGIAPLPEHKGIMGYEKRGVSGRYTWYSLPRGCASVFFPGCTFSGTRMDTTIALYEHLKSQIPSMGIVLDCCTKPSHDLGRQDHFFTMFNEMKNWLMEHGVSDVMVVCPNCHKVFKTYGAPLKTISVYEFMAETGLPGKVRGPSAVPDHSQPVTFHDPCVLRHEGAVQRAVRKLATDSGFIVGEMPHSMMTTVCCGEGGTVSAVAPEFSNKWRDIRRTEVQHRRLFTYCAGCAGMLNNETPTDHILDAVFHPDAVAAGKRRATRAPFTYFNRIRLKRYIKREYTAAFSRERHFHPDTRKPGSRTGVWLKLLFVILFAGAVAGIHFSGLTERFDADTLRRAVAAYGILAPLIYMLIYAVAPALFLPGLPITLMGGVLFGPLWGVVYSITGATAGACVAFLIARYMARDWIKARLISPRWRNLDQSVEKNGWKIVAFTRLVPLFPFNLLNYAFGLTAIPLLPYAVTSFVCMLPACIAFIVFSSSLPDLVKGEVSKELLIGILLIALVPMISIAIKKLTGKTK